MLYSTREICGFGAFRGDPWFEEAATSCTMQQSCAGASSKVRAKYNKPSVEMHFYSVLTIVREPQA